MSYASDLTDPLAPLLVARPTNVAPPPEGPTNPAESLHLAEWLTVDALPEVECEACGGKGSFECGDGLAGGWSPCMACGGKGQHVSHDRKDHVGSGRRPLRAGDRVRLVQGESEAGWFSLAHLGLPALKLPAPGTVVGEATVDLVVPIRFSSDCVDDVEHICANDCYVLHHLPLKRPDPDGQTEHEITGHAHVNWEAVADCTALGWCGCGQGPAGCPVCGGTGGIQRWAVRLREAVAL